MMKVAFLLGSLHRGGTETLLLDVFRKASKAPFEMVCIHRKGGSYQEDYYATGIKMIQCTPKCFGLLRYLWQLRQHLLREQITIVHAQQPLDCIYARLATIGTGIRIVETFHGFDIGSSGLDKWINKLSIRMADMVCFVSQYEKDYYAAHYPVRDKGRVVYNGVDFAKLDVAKSTVESVRRKVESGRIRLCMVGNFVRGRSQMVVCKALRELSVKCKMEGVTWDLYFVGRKDDSERWRYDECVQYCEEHHMTNVHFLGSRNDVPELLKTMDGFVYSTVHDTFGIAVIEAIAAGLPVIVNDWDVMKEVCGEANEGIRYFRTDDVSDAANMIEELLANLETSKKAAEANAAIVREKYSINQHIQRLKEVYETCC